MGNDDNKRVLEEIKRIAEQGSPFSDTPKPVPVAAPIPKKPIPTPPSPPPREKVPAKDEVVIPKEDFEVLVAMAKREHDREQESQIPASSEGTGVGQQQTLGQQIQMEKDMQPAMQAEYVEPQPNLGIASVDYGGLLNRPTILYFDTDRTCQLVQPKVNENGSVEIGERTFDFTEGQPSILNMGKWGRKQSHPFYILKYDTMTPIDITKYGSTNPTPEQATRLIELGTLETLSKIPGGKMKKGILILIMGVSAMIGAVSVYMMSLFGVI